MATKERTSIRFEFKTNGVSRLGHNVEGRLEIINPLERKVEDFKIFIIGVGCQTGSEKGTYQEGNESQNFGQNEYPAVAATRPMLDFATTISIKDLLPADGSNLKTLPQGTTAYPFNFHIPYDRSPRYQTSYWGIRLWLETEIRYSSGKVERTRTEISGYDKKQEEESLKDRLALRKGFRVHSNAYCRSFFGSKVWARLESWYQPSSFPGEPLDLQVIVKNICSSWETKVRAYLRCVTSLEGNDKTISEKSWWNCAGGKGGTKIRVNFNVPCPPPKKPGLLGCDHVEYFLCVDVKISGWFWSSVLSLKLPVVIGTTPRMSFSALPLDQEIVKVAPYLGNLPPPFFEEPTTSESVRASG